MAIKYYPDRVQKKYKHMAERWAKDAMVITTSGGGDCSSGYTYRFAPVCNCTITSIAVHFSATTNKTYSVSKSMGRGFIKGLNDVLYIRAPGTNVQTITLTPGFYATTSAICTEIKARLDANQAFIDSGAAPFSVTFSGAKKFVITPAAGQIQYIDYDVRRPVRRNSTAGFALGLNATTVMGANITSDTAVQDIGMNTAISSATTSAVVNVLSTEAITMNEDQSILITVDNVAVTVQHSIDYKENT